MPPSSRRTAPQVTTHLVAPRAKLEKSHHHTARWPLPPYSLLALRSPLVSSSADPMWVMPANEFMALSELRPHQELRAADKLVKWDPSMSQVFFLSHQWTSFERPDHSTAQLRTFQKTLVRMLRGKLPTTAPSFADAVHLPSKVRINPLEWKETVSRPVYIWMDYMSVPQVSMTYTELSSGSAGQASDLMKAVNSIPAYIERSSHFFAICE